MQNFDNTKNAADHLRKIFGNRGIQIGSSHAHALVAASLGYKSRAALLAPNSGVSLYSDWLSQAPQNHEEIRRAMSRMQNTALTEKHLPFIASTIADGLAPPCCETGVRSADNLPVGNVDFGEPVEEWVHPSEAQNPEKFAHCRCCGSQVIFRIDDLDEKKLCELHQGEFDRSPEEEKDWNDLNENIRNNT